VKQLVLLAEGHTLVSVPAELRADAAGLAGWLAGERIDVVDVTPALLRALRAAGWPAHAQRAPRAVLVGGEAIDEALWHDLRAVAGVAFHNLYGPTECTVDATACALGASARPGLGDRRRDGRRRRPRRSRGRVRRAW
jgi:non-ribosomal peptide synthetase component F